MLVLEGKKECHVCLYRKSRGRHKDIHSDEEERRQFCELAAKRVFAFVLRARTENAVNAVHALLPRFWLWLPRPQSPSSLALARPEPILRAPQATYRRRSTTRAGRGAINRARSRQLKASYADAERYILSDLHLLTPDTGRGSIRPRVNRLKESGPRAKKEMTFAWRMGHFWNLPQEAHPVEILTPTHYLRWSKRG